MDFMCLLIPLLQVEDICVNAFRQKQYVREYTANKCAANVDARCSDDVERLECIEWMFRDILENPNVIKICFYKAA